MNKYVFKCSDHMITIMAYDLEEATVKLQKILKRGEEIYTLDDFTLIEEGEYV